MSIYKFVFNELRVNFLQLLNIFQQFHIPADIIQVFYEYNFAFSSMILEKYFVKCILLFQGYTIKICLLVKGLARSGCGGKLL